jgi:hypothetical protein
MSDTGITGTGSLASQPGRGARNGRANNGHDEKPAPGPATDNGSKFDQDTRGDAQESHDGDGIAQTDATGSGVMGMVIALA